MRKLIRTRVVMTLAAGIAALAATSGASVSPAEPRQATAVKTSVPPRIDGRLDEAAWKTAPAADAFLQNEPLDGRPASEPTEVRVLFDEGNIYFGVRCFDSDPSRLVATEMRRDASLESDDLFEVMIDTYHDSRNAFDLPVPGGRFAANIGAARIVYAFSPALFAKAYLQWNDSEDVFRGNVLLRWIYKPGANLFLIFNESRRLGPSGAVQDRTIMLKVSFLFNI